MFQTIGVKGAFADAWSYDAYAKVGITQFGDIEGNFLGTPQMDNALNVVPNPATGGVAGVAAGAPVCAAALLNGSAPKCVPWNIWTPNSITPAQLAYLTVPSTWSTTATEFIVSDSVTGDLGKYNIKIPTAKDGMSVNVGTEYREEKFDFSPDYIFAQRIDGRRRAVRGDCRRIPRVRGIHRSAHLPIMNELPAAYNLSADAGYRYSSYTEGFNTNTYKIQLEWAPIQDVRFRGGYNRAVRAPNIDELFEPAVMGAGGTADPCWGLGAQPDAGPVRIDGSDDGPVRPPRREPGGADQHPGRRQCGT